MAKKDRKNEFAGMPPDRIEQRLLTKDQINKNRATAVSFTNPYTVQGRKIGDIMSGIPNALASDLTRINENYNQLRSNIISMYGNTTNQSLLNARDVALKELDRQADDATRQVAANYEAAQKNQLGFAQAQQELGQRSAALQASLGNVAAGNVAAVNEQLGLVDAPSVQVAQELAASAPRQAALAEALGLSSAMFETDMGTSLGSQQAAIQGQIARDLAARSGQVSTQTARDIAAAEIAALNEQRGILTNLGMAEMQAQSEARIRAADREFALSMAKIDAGVQAGLFDVEQARYLAGVAAQNAANARAQTQQEFENSLAERRLALDEEKFKAGEAGNVAIERSLPVTVKPITDFVRGKPALKDKTSGLTRETDAAALEDIAYVTGTKGMNLTQADFVAIRSLWSSISPETKADLSKLPDPVNSLEDWVNKYAIGFRGAGGFSPVPTKPSSGGTTNRNNATGSMGSTNRNTTNPSSPPSASLIPGR